MVQSEGIADGHNPFANLETVRITELEKRQLLVCIDLEQCQICFRITANKLCLYRLALAVLAVKRHTDDICTVYHVVVGDNVSVRRNDKAGTKGFLLGLMAFAPGLGSLLERAEELLESRGKSAKHLVEEVVRSIAGLDGLLCIDVDHRRAALSGKLCEFSTGSAHGGGLDVACTGYKGCSHNGCAEE